MVRLSSSLVSYQPQNQDWNSSLFINYLTTKLTGTFNFFTKSNKHFTHGLIFLDYGIFKGNEIIYILKRSSLTKKILSWGFGLVNLMWKWRYLIRGSLKCPFNFFYKMIFHKEGCIFSQLISCSFSNLVNIKITCFLVIFFLLIGKIR